MSKTKAQRKREKKWEILLDRLHKKTRKGKHVALMVGNKGRTLLCFIFSPDQRLRDVRNAKRTFKRIFSRNSFDAVWFEEYPQYPSDLLFDRKEEYPDHVLFSFSPHQLWYQLNRGISRANIDKQGYNITLLFKSFKGTERDFRACLSYLISQGLITVARNGFVWKKEVAKRVIGTGLDVKPKEIDP